MTFSFQKPVHFCISYLDASLRIQSAVLTGRRLGEINEISGVSLAPPGGIHYGAYCLKPLYAIRLQQLGSGMKLLHTNDKGGEANRFKRSFGGEETRDDVE